MLDKITEVFGQLVQAGAPSSESAAAPRNRLSPSNAASATSRSAAPGRGSPRRPPSMPTRRPPCNEGFRRLARYIFGGNTEQHQDRDDRAGGPAAGRENRDDRAGRRAARCYRSIPIQFFLACRRSHAGLFAHPGMTSGCDWSASPGTVAFSGIPATSVAARAKGCRYAARRCTRTRRRPAGYRFYVRRGRFPFRRRSSRGRPRIRIANRLESGTVDSGDNAASSNNAASGNNAASVDGALGAGSSDRSGSFRRPLLRGHPLRHAVQRALGDEQRASPS